MPRRAWAGLVIARCCGCPSVRPWPSLAGQLGRGWNGDATIAGIVGTDARED